MNPSPNRSLPLFSLDKLLTAATMISITLIPLLFCNSVTYMFEFPKVIALSVLAPILMLLLRCMPKDQHQPTGDLGVFIYIYLGWLLFKSIFSLNPSLSFFGVYSNFTGFFFYLFSISFFFLGNHFRESKLKFLFPLIITATASAIIGIIQFWKDGLTRVIGPQGNPINLANFLMLIIPCLLGILFSDHIQKSRVTRILLNISLFLSTTALILTFSRAGWIGFAVFLLLLFFSLPQKMFLRNHYTVFILFIVMSLSVASVYFLINNQPNHSFLTSNRIQTTTQPVDASRINLSKAAWEDFLHNPFGAGLCTFYFTATPFASKELRENGIFSYAHNDFMHTLATQGIVGGLLYLFFIFLLLKKWWQWRKDPKRDGLTAGLWAGLFTHLLMLQSNFPAYGYTYLFWFFVGFINHNSAVPDIKKQTLLANPWWKRLFWGLLCLGSFYYSILFFSADTIYTKANHVFGNKNYETSSLMFGKAVQLAPWVDVYRMAKLTSDLKNYQSSNKSPVKRKKIFQTIQKELLLFNSLNPLDHRYKGEIGNALIGLGLYQKAIVFLKQASALYPNYPGYYNQIGYSLIQLSKNQEAQSYFRKSLQLDPENQYAKDCLKLLQKMLH